MNISGLALTAIASSILAACVSTGSTIQSLPFVEKVAENIGIEVWGAENKNPKGGVVLMHGCAGYGGGNIDDWAERFVKRGYIAIGIDSFSTRGIGNVCNGGKVMMRVGDSYAGAKYLIEKYNVDPARLVLMGFSHGGITTNLALNRRIIDQYSRKIGTSVKFAAGISMYPYCFNTERAPDFYAPVTIIIGSNDDWTPARGCTYWKENPNPNSAPLDVNVIDGAYHSFDMFSWRGIPVGARNVRGHNISPSASATAKARKIMDAFLTKHGL